MGTIGAHAKSQPHLDAVARYEASLAAERVIPGLVDDANRQQEVDPTPLNDLFAEERPRTNTPESERPLSPLSFLRAFDFAEGNQDLDNSDVDIDLDKLTAAIHAMEDDEWGPGDEAQDEASLEADLRTGVLPDPSAWHPFKKKEVDFSVITPALRFHLLVIARGGVINHWIHSQYPITFPIPPNTLHLAYLRRWPT
ncbi:uncharacterized protein MELLADRAFT_95194 [Melampsora larici-populina 98AG31]|uniref:Uncharacterized protein n=1 Tax=Melampsora larici-populina (strain 98AG31 / pathotype 3-4-7) TaxID=747676 RepID=F4RCG8_MELLP|nr:uncharacterized protein MELLADRAFT_95194 [Melampsora larici-populina 98AG31]EGG09964.1 hypothetical protein MELLADRAFT_95194 [Melampsora larici-populina 98AG31]